MTGNLIDLQTLRQDSWPSVTLRRLSSFERLFWLMDQDRPAHIGLVAQISGKTTPAEWRRALAAVQRRHPLLTARIEADADGVPWFRQTLLAPIPFRITTGDPESDWHRALAEELVRPFDLGTAPLVRAVVIQGDDRAAFMLLMHHSVGDALAGAYVIRDVLLALSAAALEPLSITPAQDDLIDGNGEAPPSKPSRLAEPAHPTAMPTFSRRGGCAIPKIQSLRLPAEFTAKLRARARHENSSVHGALCAAMALAGRATHAAWRNAPLRILSPVDARTIHDVGECCGCYLGMTAAHSFGTAPASFWDLARLAKSDVLRAKNPQAVDAAVREFHGVLACGLDVAGAADLVETAFAREAMLSNLGELSFAGRFGDITLESLWGPVMLGRFADEQYIGAATLNGTLCLTHISNAPPDGLLETMRATLAKACLR
jgi:hypothetical protein